MGDRPVKAAADYLLESHSRDVRKRQQAALDRITAAAIFELDPCAVGLCDCPTAHADGVEHHEANA